MRAAITARLKAGKDLVSPVCIYSIAEAHVAVDSPQQCADVGGLGDGGEVLDLGRSDCAAQVGCDVLVASHRRDTIAEHPAEHAAHASGALISPGGLDLAQDGKRLVRRDLRSEEHTSELQSLMRISYAVFCLKKKTQTTQSRIT